MSDIEVLLNDAPGPLPLAIPFQNDDDSPLLLYVTGSAWTQNPNSVIGLEVLVDGKPVDSVSVYANEPGSHKTLVGKMINVPALSIGAHTITLQSLSGTTTDSNDLFSVAIMSPSDDAYVLNHQGPIPYYTTFQSAVSGPALIFLSGSAYSQWTGVSGISLVIDGNTLVTSSVYLNEINSHHAMPAVFAIANLTPGSHQIGFSTTTGDMQTDANDFFSAAVFF